MGQVYEKLGLHDLLSGEKHPEAYFSDERLLTHYLRRLPSPPKAPGQRSRKTPWMSTLAFHLLTQPELEETFT